MANDGFDADAFLQSAQDSKFDTTYEMIPPGEYQGEITAVDNARKVAPPAGADWKAFGTVDVTVAVDAPEVAAKLNRNVLSVKYQMRLDLDDSGKLDGGKNRNIPLGRLMEATGVVPPWNWQQFIGKRVTAIVYHEPDKKRDGVSYERIKAVTKAKV